MNTGSLEKLYKIARAIAETDSIGEGWLYNKRGYTWKRFLDEKRRTDEQRESPDQESSIFDQTYYNVALRIYRETIGSDCDDYIVYTNEPIVDIDDSANEVVEE